MIVTILICLFLFFLSLICSKYNIFSPSVITSGIWLLVMLLNITINHHLTPLTNTFYDAINLWVVLFCLSSLFIQSLSFKRDTIIKPSPLARTIFYYSSLVTFPFLIFTVYKIAHMDGTLNWMSQLRLASIGRLKDVSVEDTNPFYVIIWLVSYLIELQNFSKKNKSRILILFFINFAFAFITMAKINFLILFLSTIYILYINKKVLLKHALIGGIILIFIFQGIQNFRATENSAYKNTAENMITLYLLSPPPAFETLKPNSSTRFGENTFRVFYAIENKLGFTDQEAVVPLLNFINVGVGTNIYTILYPFYKDFGLTGIALFSIIIGLTMGYIFNKSTNGNQLFVIIYSFLILQIVMQYASEMFFTFFSLNFKRILIALIPFIITKYELFSRKRNSVENQEVSS